jgi:hypothetical protein
METNNTQSIASVLRMFVTMDPILAPPETIQQSVRKNFDKLKQMKCIIL